MNEYNSPSPSKASLTSKVSLQLEVGENAFWIIVWTLAALTVSTIVGLCLYYGNKEDQMVATSADPMATACALGTRSQVSNQCMAYLARGK